MYNTPKGKYMAKTSLKKISSKKKKPDLKPAVPRKSGAAKLLEEKHIGAEIIDFTNIDDIGSIVRDNLRHYNYFYDYKDAFKWLGVWVKKNRTQDLADFNACDEWRVSTAVGGIAKMHTNGARFDEAQMVWLNNKVDALIDYGKINRAEQAAIKAKPVKTSADILADRIHDFIADVEHTLDLYHDPKIWVDAEEYSIFNELKKINAPKPLAQKVYDYYKPLYDEVHELVAKKTPDLLEGYKHLKTTKAKKDYLAFVKGIIDDCQQYMTSLTAVKAPRQPRAKKKIPVEKLVAKVIYQKESDEFKVSSAQPVSIVGASEVYLFNTKYRQLIKITSSTEPLSIRGTTIINADSIVKKTLRKPDEVLKEFGKTTRARASKTFDQIKTKEAETNARINADTIILKVFSG